MPKDRKMNTDQFAEFAAAVTRSLPRNLDSTTAQSWIMNQQALAQTLRTALMPPGKVEEQVVPKTPFSVWKKIKLGTGLKSADQFRKAIKKAGGKIGDWANDIIGRPAFTAATEEIEIDLVNVSVGELGFTKGATRREIYERAIELGLELCPAEVGPQLRLQYKDQPLGEWWLRVGMEPIAVSGGNLVVFDVEHGEGGRWLNSYSCRPGSFWRADYRWLFQLPRK